MPIKYAIRTELNAPLPKKEVAEYKAQNYSAHDLKFHYEEVPSMVAEMDEENGVYAVFSNNGVKLSDWILMKEPEAITEVKDKWRTKPLHSLKDAIKQELQPGDYVFIDVSGFRKLELNRVVHVLKSGVVVESFGKGKITIRKRWELMFIKIPAELLTDGTITPEKYEKRYAVHESQDERHSFLSLHHPVDEVTARQSEEGMFSYFNSRGEQITGWTWIKLEDRLLEKLNSKVYYDEEIVESLPIPLTDALGSDIMLGDLVFSNMNYHHFMMCEVVGFTKNKVLLLAYLAYHEGIENGQRTLTLNAPKSIVKYPINF